MQSVLCLCLVFVTALNLHIASSNVAKPRDMPIQFPEPVRRAAEDDDVPAPCKDLTYCTLRPANYPEEKFNMMFKDYKPLPQPQLVVDDLTNKLGEEDDENCKSEVTYEPLYRVREKRDQPWRTVIQAPAQDYIQRVRLETCRDAGAPCFESICVASEFTPVCKQNVNTWQVLVSKGDNESENITATLPVSCSCYAQKLAYLTRFGVDKPSKDIV